MWSTVKRRRPAREDPLRVERLAGVAAAVDPYEVARARIHRQPRLGGEVAVVPHDQLVHLGEAPRARRLTPPSRELVGILDLGGERVPRLVELALVLVDRVLDRAQPAHPVQRAAERAHRRVGVGPEVAHAPAERLPRDRTVGQIDLEHAALLAVAWSLGLDRALAHDLL